MRPLFKESENNTLSSGFIFFKVPSLASSVLLTDTRLKKKSLPSRKRCRDARINAVTGPSLHGPRTVIHVLKKIIEYGNRPYSAYSGFMSMLLNQSYPQHSVQSKYSRETEISQTSLPDTFAEVAFKEHLSSVALRQALGLLSKFVVLDTQGFFLLPDRMQNPIWAVVCGTTSRPPRCTMTLYCMLQALGLELEDVSRQLGRRDGSQRKIGGMVSGKIEVREKELFSQLNRIFEQIEQCVNSLEETLIEIIFPTPRETKVSMCAGTNVQTSHVPLSYTAHIFKSLINSFQECSWPCQLLNSSYPFTGNVSSNATRYPNSCLEVQSDLSLFDLFPKPNLNPDMQVSESEIMHCIRESVTAILTEALRDLRQADACNCLGFVAGIPLAKLAAELQFQSSSPGRSDDVGIRPLIDVLDTSFSRIEAKAWSGQYALTGLRYADLEMRVLFYRLFHSLTDKSNEVDDSSTTSARVAGQLKTRTQRFRNLIFLLNRWHSLIRWHYEAFWKRLRFVPVESEEGCDRCDPVNTYNSSLFFSFRVSSVFDILSVDVAHSQDRAFQDGGREKDPSLCLTEPQRAALRVVTSLQSFDKSGWFRFPAFDLSNVDFASIMYWVQSPSFALKTKGEAFDGVRRILEQMVDACVRKYGPLHKFSECISSIRQQLVDIARREGLL